MENLIKTIVMYLILGLKAWVIFCASNWFWPALGLTFPVILAALIVVGVVFGGLHMTSAISALPALEVMTNKDAEKMRLTGRVLLFFDVSIVLFSWLVLWILYVIV